LMADGSISTRYVSVGSTPSDNDLGSNGDIWYTI